MKIDQNRIDMPADPVEILNEIISDNEWLQQKVFLIAGASLQVLDVKAAKTSELVALIKANLAFGFYLGELVAKLKEEKKNADKV